MRRKRESRPLPWIPLMVVLWGITQTVPLEAQSKVMVQLVVDQLRADYIETLTPILSDGGFVRLEREGQCYRGISSEVDARNRAMATASLLTSTAPRWHGISAPLVQDKEGRYRSCFEDPDFRGVYTREALSPQAIRVETLADSYALEYPLAKIYAVSSYADMAILLGGQRPTAAYWLDEKILSWASSSYYGEMLPLVSAYNQTAESPSKKFSSGALRWRSGDDKAKHLLESGGYPTKGFDYRYGGKDAQRYLSSPLAIEETLLMAEKILSSEVRSGDRALLAIGVSLEPSDPKQAQLNAETADRYLRLDRGLSHLMKLLDERYGAKGYILSLMGNGYQAVATQRKPEERYTLDIAKAKALINLYMGASHGRGDWVSSMSDGRIRLNKKLLQNHKLDRIAIQREVAELLSSLGGIAYAIGSEDLLLGNTPHSTEASSVYSSIVPDLDTDVYWGILKSYSTTEKASNRNLVYSTTAIPNVLYIKGADERLSKLPRAPRTSKELLETLAWSFGIRPPSGL